MYENVKLTMAGIQECIRSFNDKNLLNDGPCALHKETPTTLIVWQQNHSRSY